jgi:hypothetical protein
MVAKPVIVPAGTGTWSFMRIMSRQVSTCCHAAVIAAPFRPASRPEAGRSVRARPPFRRELRLVAVQGGHLRARYPELRRGPGGGPCLDQVLDDLGLRVDRHPSATGQLAEVRMVALAREREVDPVVLQPLGVKPAPEPGIAQQLDSRRLQHARPLTRLAVSPAAGLHHARLDAVQGKQVRQEQARRACSDDADLRAFLHSHDYRLPASCNSAPALPGCTARESLPAEEPAAAERDGDAGDGPLPSWPRLPHSGQPCRRVNLYVHGVMGWRRSRP